jgi:hypothetical protein
LPFSHIANGKEICTVKLLSCIKNEPSIYDSEPEWSIELDFNSTCKSDENSVQIFLVFPQRIDKFWSLLNVIRFIFSA